MTTCIKCGKGIPDGELFCDECSLNLLEKADSAPAASAHIPTPRGTMQTPVRRPAEAKRPAAVNKTAPKQVVQYRTPKYLKVLLAVAVVIAVLSAGLLIRNLMKAESQRVSLRLKEADLEIRERELTNLQDTADGLAEELAAANETIDTQLGKIEKLEEIVTSTKSSMSQTQYDMTNKQAELEQLSKENSDLLKNVEDLEKSVDELEKDLSKEKETNKELSATASAYAEKANFMDAHVVFVENDGSNYYHKYDCRNFTKKKYWAYSKKLAQSTGYKPCPICCKDD